MRFPSFPAIALLVGLATGLVACGSVGGKPTLDARGAGGSAGTDASTGAGGQGATDGGAGGQGAADGGGQGGAGGQAATDGGGQGGAGGAPLSNFRVRGGIEAVGVLPAAGTVRILRAGLTYPRTRVCNGSVCVSGGIAP